MQREFGVGIDLVRVSRVQESLAQFGERFLRRVFTDGEIAYAQSAPALTAERLAARFAAKEATMKALDLDVAWRQIEVDGRQLRLHGEAAQKAGNAELAFSLSHEGDYATAVVFARQEMECQSK